MESGNMLSSLDVEVDIVGDWDVQMDMTWPSAATLRHVIGDGPLTFTVV